MTTQTQQLTCVHHIETFNKLVKLKPTFQVTSKRSSVLSAEVFFTGSRMKGVK